MRIKFATRNLPWGVSFGVVYKGILFVLGEEKLCQKTQCKCSLLFSSAPIKARPQAGKVMDRWAYERQIGIDFSRPGKPTDNTTVESFNGRLRQECLNENGFPSLAAAREKIETWGTFYNQVRLHSALEWFTLSDYARKHAVSRRKQHQREWQVLVDCLRVNLMVPF
jgi:hypothetical protein